MKHKCGFKKDFVAIDKTDFGYTTGYCKVCHADMTLFDTGELAHYKSHQLWRDIQKQGCIIQIG